MGKTGKRQGTQGDAATIDVAAQLAELQVAPMRDLQKRYQELFGAATKSRNRDYLVKKLAWKIQERAEGGLSKKARRRLAQLSKGTSAAPRPGVRHRRTLKKQAPDDRDARLPATGTVLTRVHKGVEHKVTVLEEGFEYNGELYGSLSRIAKQITGMSWNGWVFFHVK